MKKVIMTPSQLHEITDAINSLTVTGNDVNDLKNNMRKAALAAKSAGVSGVVSGGLNPTAQTSNSLAGVSAGDGCDDATKEKVVGNGGKTTLEISECVTKKQLEERRIANMKKTGTLYTKSQLDEMLKK